MLVFSDPMVDLLAELGPDFRELQDGPRMSPKPSVKEVTRDNLGVHGQIQVGLKVPKLLLTQLHLIRRGQRLDVSAFYISFAAAPASDHLADTGMQRRPRKME